jgi:hypothetical protein
MSALDFLPGTALRAFPLTALPLALAISAPAFAQQEAGDSVRFVTVVGDEECPESTDTEIVVCNRYDRDEQFRVPEDLRGDPDSAPNQSWVRRVETLDELGEAGALSCSPEGLGGFTGCTQEMIDAYYAEKERPSVGRASEVINARRDERLAEIDAEAEAEEARVQEAIARQQELRRQRDTGPATGGEDGLTRDDFAVENELAVPSEDLLEAEPEMDGGE